MSENPTIRELIDACRAGSTDLSLAELAALAREVERNPAVADELRRSQRLDKLVSEALHDVPVPAGLAERILAASESRNDQPEVSLPEQAEVSRGRFWIGGRRWLLAAGSLSLAVVLTVLIYQLGGGWSRPIAPDQLASDVTECINVSNATNWRTDGLPAGIALGSVVAVPRQPRWQKLPVPRSAGWSGSVTAVDLAGPGRPQAILFVVHTSARFSVPSTPTTTSHLPLTGGYKATAWQEPASNLLYVLVAKDRGQRLDVFLRKPREA